MKINQIPTMLKMTQILFFVNAAAWLVFGVLGFTQLRTGSSNLRLIYSVLMVANAAVLVWFGVMIIRAQAHIFFLAILYIALNAVLSITDQFGWIDALILFLNLTNLGLLFVTRQRLLQATQMSE
jgi:hypothetical protein